MRPTLVGFGLLTLLAACDGGGDPVEQALRDASAANHAATVREGEVSAPVRATDAGQSVDEVSVARMIAHHRRTVAIADAGLARSDDPELRRIAGAIKESRMREIAELEAWTPAGPTTP